MPVYDEKLARNRPGKAYLSHTSRHGRIRLEQGQCPMSSKAGMFEQETQCNFIGEVKLCVTPKYIWQHLWWTILSLKSLQDLVCFVYLTYKDTQQHAVIYRWMPPMLMWPCTLPGSGSKIQGKDHCESQEDCPGYCYCETWSPRSRDGVYIITCHSLNTLLHVTY